MGGGGWAAVAVCSRPIFPPRLPRQGADPLELPSSHRVPVSWLRENACAPIRWRTVTEILPQGAATPTDLEYLRAELLQYKGVTQTIKKQRANGIWAGNILGLAANKAQGIKDVGTVAQYRRLLELGLPQSERVFRRSERTLFRLLSRDEDPALFFEHQKATKTNPDLAIWTRDMMRQATTAALAHAGLVEDPRVRGAAHKIATRMSQFLRSELAEKPIKRKASRNILEPEAYPPTVYSVAIMAYMPDLQRERAGFVERLGAYISQPETKRSYVIKVGRKIIQPTVHVLGDPLRAESNGNPKDLPFALHWIELLVRLGMLKQSSTAQRILGRLLRDCDANGVWNPRNLRAFPKSSSRLADFAFPLELDGKTLERRKADVTFRLAHIAKLAGWDLEFV